MNQFDEIFKKYYHPLFIYALKFVESDEQAMDIVQDVFTIVWEKQKYELSNDHLKSFLFKSIHNTCLNYLKHQDVIYKFECFEKKNLIESELHYFEGGEKSLIEKEDLDKIYSAINSLSNIHKEVLLLSRFDELNNAQIAETLNIPVRTVETRLYRALVELRKKLSKKLIYTFFYFN